jgi:uncharacterized protein with von Willebrand factor type A (vWA) domain
VPEKIVASLAHDFNWKDKAAGRQRLDTEEGQEHERTLNRVSSYIMGERLSRVFSNLIAELDSDPTFAKAFCTAVDEDGNTKFSTKNLVDLAKGAQIVNDIKYRALGDKLAQQADVSTGTANAADFALRVYKGLAKRFDAVLAVDTSAEVMKAVRDEAANRNAETTAESNG